MLKPRWLGGAASFANGDALICGGTDVVGATSLVECERLTVLTAVAFASFQTARQRVTVTSVGSDTFVACGGSTGTTYLSSCEKYTVATGIWTQYPAILSSPRRDHTATLLDSGELLVCGGESAAGAVVTTCDVLNPGNMTLVRTIQMTSGRSRFTAVKLATGLFAARCAICFCRHSFSLSQEMWCFVEELLMGRVRCLLVRFTTKPQTFAGLSTP